MCRPGKSSFGDTQNCYFTQPPALTSGSLILWVAVFYFACSLWPFPVVIEFSSQDMPDPSHPLLSQFALC